MTQHDKRRGKVTDQVRAAVQERRRAGVPIAELEKQFGLSHGSIVNACKAPPAATPPQPVQAPRERVERPLADDAAGDLRALLHEQVAALKMLAEAAVASREVTVFTNVSRVLNATTALLSKMTPPPPVDPNESPDMIVLAKKARAKLHDLVDRALGERR